MYIINEQLSGISDMSGQEWSQMLEETGLVQGYKEKYPTNTKESIIVTDDLFNSNVIIWSAAVERPPHIAELKVTTFGGHMDAKLICKDIVTLETLEEYQVGSSNVKDTDCFR